MSKTQSSESYSLLKFNPTSENPLFDFLTKIKVPPVGFRGEINGEDELRRIVETGFIECLILCVYIILYRIKLL
jgi:hypothetical protein